MSKFKQALMISVMVFLSAFVILSMVKDQMRQERQIQHYRQLDSLLESTGLDYIEDFNPFAETTDMRIGLYADGEGYGIVTACLAPEEITGGEMLRSAMYPVDTGDETVQAWYGICGTEAEPQLLLLLDEDNPRCRDVDLVGNRTAGQMDTKGTVQKILTDLSGLPDDGNQIEVTLYTAEVQEVEVKNGFSFNNAIERTGQEVYAAAQKIKETRKPYLSFTIDLNEALEQMNW